MNRRPLARASTNSSFIFHSIFHGFYKYINKEPRLSALPSSVFFWVKKKIEKFKHESLKGDLTYFLFSWSRALLLHVREPFNFIVHKLRTIIFSFKGCLSLYLPIIISKTTLRCWNSLVQPRSHLHKFTPALIFYPLCKEEPQLSKKKWC